MPDPPGFVVKNDTNRLPVFDNPGPSSSTHSSIVPGTEPEGAASPVTRPGLADGVNRVPNQIYEELLELVTVSPNRELLPTRRHGDVMRLSSVTTIDERADVERRQLRRRHLASRA